MTDTIKKPQQNMADSPEEMLKILSDISFLTPEKLQQKTQCLHETHFHQLDMEETPRPYIENDKEDIRSEEIEAFAMKLVDISKQSREEGNILWGRVQGTKYEAQAQTLVANTLLSFGIDDVRQDFFPIRYPQWNPTKNELTVTVCSELEAPLSFEHAITPFPSGQTPEEGLEAEIIYVGQGTVAELKGRNLNGKIVLLQADFSAGGPMYSSARTAYSRIASGKYGMPLGLIAWWTLPGAKQIATRVGAMGGGDAVGTAIPWISIGYDDGLYLRKLLDRATDDVLVKMVVKGEMEDGSTRQSSNVYGFIPGTTGKYILMTFHSDSYFYGLHDNGGTAAMVMAAAKHYAARPLEQRGHGLAVLSVGDHEHPGVGATDRFIEDNHHFVRDEMLMVLRPEKLGLIAQTKEGPIQAKSNQAIPAMQLITNRSPILLDIFKQAVDLYSLPSADFYYQDPAADETHFHPPFAKFDDLDAISTGWAISSYAYHSTADYDLGLISFKLLEKYAKAHIFIVDSLKGWSKEDLQKNAASLPEQSIYSSELFKVFYGNF
ncbi:hypothetical protein [Vibrio rotiferianus]|uniref:hypothetical protein n=1 Tax=Vibrio rotiferianus TaxID=190895 RepID=UPI000B59C680|nr:hypothetical protein [Vibrio rotiferianus]ASI96144.1 hypothetical protein BSZ04_14265 [Vibrio rotiferianus]